MPTKNYVNGSDKFRIILFDPRNAQEVLDFSFNYTALHEYDLGVAARVKLDTGAKKKKLFHVDMEWEIDFSGLFKTPDAMLVQEVKNAEFQGKTIYLIPHIDVDTRIFKVQVIEKQRKLGQYYNEQQNGPNKDYIIWFENVDAITEYNWIDPNLIGALTGSVTGTTDTPMEGELQT